MKFFLSVKGDDEDGYMGIANLKVCYFEVRTSTLT